MSLPRLARVVGAIDAAVELHEDPLRPRRRALQAVHAEADLVLRHAFGQIARDEARRCRLRHVAPPSSVSHTPAAEMPTASRSGSPGHVTIECRQSPPAPGCHFGRVGCFQSARLSSQLAPPSRLSNSTPGSPPA